MLSVAYNYMIGTKGMGTSYSQYEVIPNEQKARDCE